jgi:hypothetical protein
MLNNTGNRRYVLNSILIQEMSRDILTYLLPVKRAARMVDFTVYTSLVSVILSVRLEINWGLFPPVVLHYLICGDAGSVFL